MDTVERFPATAQLLGAYLHQNFDLDHGTSDAALRAAVSESGAERLAAVRDEVRHPRDAGPGGGGGGPNRLRLPPAG